MSTLPIDALLPEIQAVVRGGRDLILQAEPGAGKTTRVPPALLDAVPGQILVLEPRRLAARLAADWIARSRGERVGETIGYHVRLERVAGPRTRLRFITEGLFLKYLADDPNLAGVGCLVLDEFHERHLHSDAALAAARHLQRSRRPDLRLVVMSATLDSARLAAWHGDAAVVDAPGRVFPVEDEFLPQPSRRELPLEVRDAVAALAADPRCPGHVLVFLPGAADIRRCAEVLEPWARRGTCRVLPLMAELPLAEQQAVLAPSVTRKVILATNVAETSITIDGVTGVVDSGLAKVPGYAPWNGLPTLDIRPVSQASCRQRAGRAGRTAPGVVRRLFTRQDFQSRPPFTPPEIVRLDLASILLDLAAAGLCRADSADRLPWLDPPPAQMLASGVDTLRMLGAADAGGDLTPVGRQLAQWPLHPRLARVAVEGGRRGVAGAATLAALLVGEGMALRPLSAAPAVSDSDVLWQLEIILDWQARRPIPSAIRPALDRARLDRVVSAYAQVARAQGLPALETIQPPAADALAACFLAGFPDRVAQVRRPGGARRAVAGSALDRIELNLCLGGGARLSPGSTVRDERFLIAVSAEDSPSRADAGSSAVVQVAVGIAPEQLLEAPPGFFREEVAVAWDGERERVVSRARLTYGGLLIEEAPVETDLAEAEAVLSNALSERWPKPFPEDGPLRQYAARVDFLCRIGAAGEFPDLSETEFSEFLNFLCRGKRSFAEIARKSLAHSIRERLGPERWARLERLAPESIPIGAGRKVPVHYELGAPPWIASRLQDFFGTARTPSLAGGKVLLVIHLLAPNQRPLQVTTDLAGFWEREYPKLRREYMRRYPRHAWPEDPLTAAPPPLKARSPQRQKRHKESPG